MIIESTVYVKQRFRIPVNSLHKDPDIYHHAHRRDAGGPDQHPADRIGEVKENAKDGRDINDAFPDMVRLP